MNITRAPILRAMPRPNAVLAATSAARHVVGRCGRLVALPQSSLPVLSRSTRRRLSRAGRADFYSDAVVGHSMTGRLAAISRGLRYRR